MFSIFSIIYTNIGGSNGFLLTWFAPTNYQFHLQWTPLVLPTTWNNFNGVISDLAPNSPTNGLFQYFDDGSQTGGFGPTRFYRLLLLNSPSNTAPFFLTAPASQFLSSAGHAHRHQRGEGLGHSPADTDLYSLQQSGRDQR